MNSNISWMYSTALRSWFIVAHLLSDTPGPRGAQKPSTNHHEQSSPPTDKDGCPQLPLLWLHHQWIVEVSDHGICHPTGWYKTQNTCNEKENPSCCSCPDLGSSLDQTICTLAPSYTSKYGHQCDHQSNDENSPRGLKVWRQSQHGVINLALHLASALHHTGHPQTLPDNLRSHDVAANESSYTP